MRMNLHHSANVTLLVGLLLAIFVMGISYDFSTSPTPASTQPALFVSPLIFKVPLATRTSEVFDPAPIVFVVPPTTSTPEIEIPTLAPDIASTAVTSDVHSQSVEPAETAQPEEDRTPTRLVIPAIGLDTPVEPVGWHTETRDRQPVNVWDVPDHFAAGWLKTSAPVGMPGNTVLDGHHNILGRVFKNLVDLEVGDFITLYTASQERIYRVEQKLILQEAYQPIEVRQANAQYIYPTDDERLTLVTCWPPTDNTYRLIIIARPVSIPPPALSFIKK